MADNSHSESIGVLGLLGVAFVILKLCGVIQWSWWYVTMPFWGGAVLILGLVAIAFAVAGIAVGIVSLIDFVRSR